MLSADGFKVPVSAYLITFNNARTLERALRSVVWADEIVVVDSFSTDDTVAIARRFTAQVEQRAWPGFRDQYQYAAERCRHHWVLFVDADEELAPELAAEIQAELPRNAARPDAEQVRGYYGHRRTFYLGRWLLHGGWVPDREIRLYRRDGGRWEGALHAKVEVRGRTAHLRHFYYHYTYADIAEQLATIDRYSSTAADDMVKAGKRFSWFRLLLNPPLRFVRDYLLRRGFLDGMPGFIVAVNTMFYVFIKYAKLWERQRVAPGDPPVSGRPRP